MVELVLAFGCATAGVAAFVRDRRDLNRLEDKIREIRTVLAADFPYRVPGRGDEAWQEYLQKMIDHHKPFADCDLRMLGDLVMEMPNGHPISMMRVLVSADSKTVVYITVYNQSDFQYASALLESYATEAEYITHVDNPVRASAPFSHQQTLASTLPHREIVARHAAFAKTADIRITSLDELLRELRRNHAMFKRWRESLSPDDLLEADLRTVLGAAYPIHGARWKRRLALRLPQATLRR